MQSLKRNLVAILFADMTGYSRMMAADELGAMESIATCREILAQLLRRYHGNLVNTAGDGLFVTFESVVNALHCAIDFQGALRQRNSSLPADRRMEFRIGINIDDIIIDGRDILGDGVNVAARIEGIADPGDICVSDAVYTTTRNKVSFEFESLGERTLKNIPEPVGIYRIALEDEPPATAVDWDGVTGDERLWVLKGEGGKSEHIKAVVTDSELRRSGDGIFVGRDARICRVVIEDESLSRCHARLTLAGGELLLEDMDSSNGTVADGTPVRPFQPARLHHGSSIQMGQVILSLSVTTVSRTNEKGESAS